MLTPLGSRRANGGNSDGDVVDALLECHGRIRRFLSLARMIATVGATTESAPEAEVRDAAEQVRRYFTIALPLHALDEDESVAPRLLGRDPEVDAALRAMTRDHDEHQHLLDHLATLLGAIIDRPASLAARAPDLLAAVTGLEGHFEIHLAREESAIFPAIRRLLDEDACAAIARELRARRVQK